MPDWSVAIHGGAGLIRRDSLTPEREAACRASLGRIVALAATALADGAGALDVVELAVRELEEDPLFNAGRGAVLNRDGLAELDASIMDGRTRAAGAVAAVRTTRNPITLARAVMERTPHVLLAEAGADAFAREIGLEQVDRGWFVTEERRAQLAQVAGRGAVGLDHGDRELDRYGTVGAVARDRHGSVAAATSTGGMVNKRPGRVGDSPIIGAGTYAWDATCAVSGTGHGEPFVRLAVAARVSALIELAGLDLAQACHRVIHEELPALSGEGGVIAVDRHGNLATPFNTAGMFRATARSGEPLDVGIW